MLDRTTKMLNFRRNLAVILWLPMVLYYKIAFRVITTRHLRPFWGANKNFLYFLLFFAKIVKITMVKMGKTFK